MNTRDYIAARYHYLRSWNCDWWYFLLVLAFNLEYLIELETDFKQIQTDGIGSCSFRFDMEPQEPNINPCQINS